MDIEHLIPEELIGLLDHPEEIETGCENNCDSCLDEAIRMIKKRLEGMEFDIASYFVLEGENNDPTRT